MDDKLLQLKRKKLRQKVLYLRTELDETKLIFQDSLVVFNEDFGKYFNKENIAPDGKRVTDDEPVFDIPKENVNLIFKKIAQKTHPDKLVNKDISELERSELVDLYKEAQKSVENKDWARVIEISNDLGIDISNVKNDDSEYLVESIKVLEEKINELRNTYAWIWKHTPKEQKKIIRKQILQSLGLKEEEK